jgi:hypothetical protein
MRSSSAIVSILGAFLILEQLSFGAPPASAPRFETEILPLFQAKCLRCHGEKGHKAELDLRTATSVLKGGESGAAVVPGKAEKSLLYQKVHEGEMPPAKKDRLTPAEVDLIRRWIAAGARSGAAQDTAALNQHDVLPILMRRCTVCHGARRQEAKLDLRNRVGMLRGGKSGPAIIPGKPEDSLLIKKIRTEAMPPRQRLVEVSIKPIESMETETLARWIAQGAPEVNVEPDVATTTPDPLVSDRDRDFWAFKSARRQAVPDIANPKSPIRNPIDAFLVEKLQAKGLSFNPEAPKEVLLRRAHLDLTGLPAEPEEVERFLADRDPAAYEKLIDRLLASPRYGERWGRHWLDLAGYADSEGKREQDLPRPHAWRYRDYVIRSLNADKPYDRFLLEQLAGDELADYEKAPQITQAIQDNLVATGFLRMAPDVTWANITGYIPDRLEVIADEIDILGSGIMGLTMKCARCHSHKFDPIPQRDYYRLTAIFKGAFDENDWLKPDVRPGTAPLSQDVQPPRNLPHVMIAERRAWEAQKPRPAEPQIQALWDRGEPTPSYIYRRGDYLSPGRLVGPGVPSVLTDGKTPFEVKPPWPGAKKTGRRLAFARWLTQPDHPLTARVLVNRMWKHHFGTGIVRTLGNFGKAGARPSHPELLDWLAWHFAHSGWSMKEMHSLMMTSAAYRQSSAVTVIHEKLDPENALFSRMPLVRMDAEVLYDSLLLAAGRLDESRFGPGDAVRSRPDGLVSPAETARGWRRLMYVQQVRKKLPTHLETFDYPQMNPNCLERRNSTVAPQALHLMNNGMVQQLAEQFARRVRKEAGDDPARQVERVYLIALSRLPSKEEKRIGSEALARFAKEWGKESQEKALATFCHAIVNSAAFVYVD